MDRTTNTTEKPFSCRKCGVEFPRTEEYFYKWRYRSDGLYYYCKPCTGKHTRSCRSKRPEHYRELSRLGARKQRLSNPTRFKEAKQRYFKRHPERVRAYKRDYRSRNPWQIKGEQNRRQARRRGATGTYSQDDVYTKFREQNGQCFWCKKILPIRYHIDHYVPISRGGTNWPSNIVLSCSKCNCSRGDRLASEWSPE